MGLVFVPFLFFFTTVAVTDETVDFVSVEDYHYRAITSTVRFQENAFFDPSCGTESGWFGVLQIT